MNRCQMGFQVVPMAERRRTSRVWAVDLYYRCCDRQMAPVLPFGSVRFCIALSYTVASWQLSLLHCVLGHGCLLAVFAFIKHSRALLRFGRVCLCTAFSYTVYNSARFCIGFLDTVAFWQRSLLYSRSLHGSFRFCIAISDTVAIW